MDFLASTLASIGVSLVLVEVYAWLPKASERLLHIAVRILPLEERERCREEWSAALSELPNTVVRLWHAASFLVAARRIRADAAVTTPEVRLQLMFSKILDGQTALAKAYAELKSNLDEVYRAHCALVSACAPENATVRKLDEAMLTARALVEGQGNTFDRASTLASSASQKCGQFFQLRDRRHAARIGLSVLFDLAKALYVLIVGLTVLYRINWLVRRYGNLLLRIKRDHSVPNRQ